MLGWKIFISKNSVQILYIFSCDKCISFGLWVDLFVPQIWVQAEITVHTL